VCGTLRLLAPLLAGNMVILRCEEPVLRAQLAALKDLLTKYPGADLGVMGPEACIILGAPFMKKNTKLHI
jgi:hypothetical protein